MSVDPWLDPAETIEQAEERVWVEQLAESTRDLDEIDAEIIAAILDGANQSEAAASAGIARSTFYLRLDRLQERLAGFFGREPPTGTP